MIFKIEKRRRRKAGKVVEDRIYSLRYRLGDMPGDKWVSLKTSDKVVAHSKAEVFRRQKERELAGMELPPLQVSARKAPIGELIADYVGEMTLQRRDGRYVKGTKAKLERLAGKPGGRRWPMSRRIRSWHGGGINRISPRRPSTNTVARPWRSSNGW